MEGAGIALARQYRDQGLDTLHEHAQFEDGSVSVEAGLMLMLDRMRGGRFKVFDDVSNDGWALQDAASVAGLLITTEAMVAEVPKKEAAPAMPGGGMGGMDY